MACKCDAALGELKEKTSVSKSSRGKERSERTYLVLHPSERIPMRGISEVLAEGEFCRENSQSIIEDESEKYKAAVLNFENRPALPSSMEFDPMSSPISSQPLRAAMDSSSTNRASTLTSIDVPFALLSPYATPPLKLAERAQIHRSLQFNFEKAVLLSRKTRREAAESPQAIAWLPLDAYDQSLSEEVLREYWEQKGAGQVSPKNWDECFPLVTPPRSARRWRRLEIESFVREGLLTVQEDKSRASQV